MPDTHTVTLTSYYTTGRIGHRARCSCGWSASWDRTTKGKAAGLAMDHLRDDHGQPRRKADVLSEDPRTFDLTREELVEACREIVADHLADEIVLSLRGLYYALVSAGLVQADASAGDASASKADQRANYRRISDTLARAKEAGEFPLDYLRDDLRVPDAGATVDHDVDVDDGVAEATAWLEYIPKAAIKVDRWYGQPVVPVVVYEKDALSGTLRRPLEQHRPPYLCLRGYPSWPAVYSLYVQLAELQERIEDWPNDPEVVVLYMGDHDPDGMEIPEATMRILDSMVEHDGRPIPDLQWRRVALTLEQAQATGAPSIGVKASSSRAPKYRRLHHPTDAWEIEAMPAVELRDELDQALAACFDRDVYRALQAEVADRRRELVRRLTSADDLADLVAQVANLDEDLAAELDEALADTWAMRTLAEYLED